VPLDVEMATEKLRDTNHQVLIQFQQKLLKQEVVQFILRSINLLILFGIRRNFLSSGRSSSLHPFERREIKEAVAIIEENHFCQLHTKFYPISCCQG